MAEAPHRLAQLRELYRRTAAQEAGALEELRRALHKLAGSGGSYGLPEVSADSREAEQLAARCLALAAPPGPAELAELGERIEAVAASFDRARAAEGV